MITRSDRLVLRTLAINGVFLGVLLYGWSGSAFHALALRGDWMLDGEHGPTAERLRKELLAFADGLDHRHGSGVYGKSDGAPDPTEVDMEPVVIDVQPPAPGQPEQALIDPIVATMPDEAQTSVAEEKLRQVQEADR